MKGMRDCMTPRTTSQDGALGRGSDIIGEERDGAVLRKEPAHIHHRRPNGDGSVSENGAVEACGVSDRRRAAHAEEDVAGPRAVLEQDTRPHRGQETGADLEQELAGRDSLGVEREHAVQLRRRRELVHAGRERHAAERHARQDPRRRQSHARAVRVARVALALHRGRRVDLDRTGDSGWEAGNRHSG